MANKSVLGKQDVNSAGGSRHGFSLGQNFKFSMSTGMLLPAYSCFVNVGEKITGKPSFFIRADHLAAPVMGDVDVFVDNFFVPLRHIYAPAEQWIYQIDDNNTDLITMSQIESTFPVVNSGYAPFYFMTQTEFDRIDSFGCKVGFNLHRLLMHLGYNPQCLFKALTGGSPATPANPAYPSIYHPVFSNVESPNMPVYKLAAYQKIYFDYYRNTDFEENNVRAYNVDSCYNSGTVQLTTFASPQTTRAGMFMLRYRDINKDYFTAIHPQPLYSDVGMMSNASNHLAAMNNWLNTGFGVDNNGVNVYPSGSVVETTDNDKGQWSRNTTIASFGSGSGELNYSGAAKNFRVGALDDLLHSHEIDLSNVTGMYNTALLRGMFALDKLLRITQRAGKHVDDQTLAHFGFKQPAGVSNETYVLKSYHTLFHFGEVTATAATSDADLGQMAGRGVAVMSKDEQPFSFVAPCPGIFMSIISCAPRRTYIGAVEKDGFKVYLADFFKPAIDNLGQQPLFGYETGSSFYYSDRMHWQYRWMEDKVKFDKASFVYGTNEKSVWTFSFPAPFIRDAESLTDAYLNRFKVSPYDVNRVFVQGYDGRPDYPTNDTTDANYCNFCTAYLTDPFNVDFQMQFTRVSKMSIFGEPVLGGIC